MKSIMRQMRRYYTDEFNKMSRFKTIKRYRGNTFYHDSILAYSTALSMNIIRFFKRSQLSSFLIQQPEIKQQFSLLLAYLIYPKEAATSPNIEQKAKDQYSGIFNFLQDFCIKRVTEITETYQTLNYIVQYFLCKEKNSIIEKDSTNNQLTQAKYKYAVSELEHMFAIY